MKFLKYFLNPLFCILILTGCQHSPSKEDKEKANEMINGNADILGYSSQGSPEMMLYTEQAINLDPNNADAWRELSIPYLKRGMPLRWKPLFDKAVALNPVEWQGWRGYLYLYFYRNYKKAIEDFDMMDVLTPDFDDYPQGQSVNYMRGIAYLGLKDYKKSIFYFDTYIIDQINGAGEDYAEVTAFLYCGIAHYLRKDYTLAKENFEKVLKYSGNHYADAHYYLSKCAVDEQMEDKALFHIEKAIKDFRKGYSHTRNYVEVIHQIYIQDLEYQKSILKK